MKRVLNAILKIKFLEELQTPGEKFNYFFQSGFFGIFFLKLYLSSSPSIATLTQNDYFKTYILAWLYCPLLGLAFGLAIHQIRTHWKIAESYHYVYSHFANGLFILFILGFGFNLSELCLFVAFFLLQGVLLVFAHYQKANQYPKRALVLLYGFLVLFCAWINQFEPGWLCAFKSWTLSNYLFFIIVVLTFYFGADPIKGKPKELFLYLVILIAIAFGVLDPHLNYNEDHTSFYLGPLADLLAGKSLLVNVNAQYGIFVFYFLKLFFTWLPLGFKSFTLVGNLLLIAQFFLYFFIVRHLFPSRLYCLLCLSVLLILNYYGPQLNFPFFIPSVGPLRFGFIYLLAALGLLRNQYPAQNCYFWIIEGLVAGAAFFWSFEVCVYTLPAFLTLIAFEFLLDFNPNVLFKRLEWLFFFILAILCYLYLDIYSKSHEFPHWSHYFDLIFYYRNGYGSLPMPAVGYWWIIIGILYFSFFAILGILSTPMEKLPANLNIALLLTIYGIFQFFYYLGRSHENNLFHICMPTVTLFFYWIYLLKTSNINFLPSKIKNIVFALFVFLIAFFIQTPFSNALEVIHKRSVPFRELLQNIILASKDLPRNDDFAKKAASKISRYSPTVKYPVYFFGKNDLDVSLYTGYSKAYPYNDVGQAFFCPLVAERIFSFDPKLKPGDYIYLSQDYSTTLEAYLFTFLEKNYKLQLVEKGRIAVFRVRSFQPRKQSVIPIIKNIQDLP